MFDALPLSTAIPDSIARARQANDARARRPKPRHLRPVDPGPGVLGRPPSATCSELPHQLMLMSTDDEADWRPHHTLTRGLRMLVGVALVWTADLCGVAPHTIYLAKSRRAHDMQARHVFRWVVLRATPDITAPALARFLGVHSDSVTYSNRRINQIMRDGTNPDLSKAAINIARHCGEYYQQIQAAPVPVPSTILSGVSTLR